MTDYIKRSTAIELMKKESDDFCSYGVQKEATRTDE